MNQPRNTKLMIQKTQLMKSKILKNFYNICICVESSIEII